MRARLYMSGAAVASANRFAPFSTLVTRALTAKMTGETIMIRARRATSCCSSTLQPGTRMLVSAGAAIASTSANPSWARSAATPCAAVALSSVVRASFNMSSTAAVGRMTSPMGGLSFEWNVG